MKRLVAGDGLGGGCGALQGQQVILHLFLGLDLGRHVERHHEAGGLARILNRPGHDLHRKQRTVLAPMLPGFLPNRHVAGVIVPAPRRCGAVDIRLGHGQEFARRIAVIINGGLVDRQEFAACPVKHPHGHGRGLEQRRVALLAVNQRLLGQLAARDVALHGNPVGETASGIGNRHDVKLNPEGPAAFGVVDQLGPNRLPFPEGYAHAVKFGPLRQRALQKARRLALHFGAAVAGVALKRGIDKHDTRPRLAHRLGLGDDHHVVQVGNAGFKQPQMRLRGLLRGHVPHDGGEEFAVRAYRPARSTHQRETPPRWRAAHARPRPPCAGMTRR